MLKVNNKDNKTTPMAGCFLINGSEDSVSLLKVINKFFSKSRNLKLIFTRSESTVEIIQKVYHVMNKYV